MTELDLNKISLYVLVLTNITTFTFCVLYFRKILDIQNLKKNLRSLLRNQSLSPGVHYLSSEIDQLWRMLLTIVSRNKFVDRNNYSYNQLLSFSSKIAIPQEDLVVTAKQVADLLLEQTQPDSIAIGIVLREIKSEELYLEYLTGLPSQRLGNSILMCVEHHLDSIEDNLDELWNYRLSQPGTVYDFSTFSIGSTLIIPLRNTQGICGAIWIGLNELSNGLTIARKAFIKALAKHASATFYASQKVKEHTNRNKEERDLFIGISHDLRAPGNSALYALRDILGGELGSLTTEQHLRLSLVEQCLEDQLALVGDILDFAKHQKKALVAHREHVYLKTSIQTILETFALNAARENLNFSMNQIPEVAVFVDSRHFQRILANFLSNAIKYTKTGSISVHFECLEKSVKISVLDTGLGIPPDDRGFLFREFTRLDNSKGIQGVGLGLALTKVLAELNGARVYFEPNKKNGSIFGVELERSPEDATVLLKHNIHLKSIVVVDDDLATCRTNVRYLKPYAETIIPARNCRDAIMLAREIIPDLIVTDLQLGDQTVENLFQVLVEENLFIPIILLTGSCNTQMLSKWDPFLSIIKLQKPISRADLATAVQRVVLNLDLNLLKAAS